MRDTEGTALHEAWALEASDLDFISTANKLCDLGQSHNRWGPPFPPSIK